MEQEDVFKAPDKDYSKEIFETLKGKHDSKTVTGDTLSKLNSKHMLTILYYLKHHRPAI